MTRLIITVRSVSKMVASLLVVALLGAGAFLLYKRWGGAGEFEITDDLGGSIFPSVILATATTDALLIQPSDTLYLGNPKSAIAVRMRCTQANSRVRIEVGETPFFRNSVSEFVLPQKGETYTIYPDIIWNYEALRGNGMAEPVSVAVKVMVKDKEPMNRVRTFSVRSVNECLLGYVGGDNKYHSTGIFFAAYVNEENPLIDGILREALNTRIVNRFSGYQDKRPGAVDKQVYALWNVLQKRHFKYSSISNSSLSSNLVFSQRVRTFQDALESSQINCVDGSVLFASLLRAINIDPVLVRLPGHMFVGYYTDAAHQEINFLETTMIGDIDLEELDPDEVPDSIVPAPTQNERSLRSFEKSKAYARKKYEAQKENFGVDKRGYMFLEISRGVRRVIQPIGK